MRKKWNHWNSSKAVGQFKLDSKAGCLRIDIAPNSPPESTFCFLKRFPVLPGRTYQATVDCKTANLPQNAIVSMSFQAQNAKAAFLGLPPQRVKLPKINSSKWNKLSLKLKIPVTGKWTQTRFLLVTLGGTKGSGGTILFDNFTIQEIK
jgi:hypothetical protein